MFDQFMSALSSLSNSIGALTEEVRNIRNAKDDNVAAIRIELDTLKAAVSRPQSYATTLSSTGKSKGQPPSAPHAAVNGSRPTSSTAPGPEVVYECTGTTTSIPSPRPKAPAPPAPPTARTKNTDPTERGMTSIYVKPAEKRKPVDPGTPLQGVMRPKKRKAFHLGSVTPGCTADTIVEHCRIRKVEVQSCRVSESRKFGTAFAHLVILQDDVDKVHEEDFWPSYVTIRDWEFKEYLGPPSNAY